MSGICGIADWGDAEATGGWNREDLARMLTRTIHLGPDGCVKYADSHVALGQLLDHQTPESEALTVPVASDDGQLVLVADVRLDNRPHLLERVGVRAEDGATWSDERLLLRAFESLGIGFVEHLLGDYFIAVWDKANQRLWLIRDHLGMQPAYYYRTRHGVIFGSEVNAITTHSAFERKLCRTRVADFLGLGFEDDELTFYDGLLRLPPGSLLAVSPDGISKRKYWDLRLAPELRLTSHHEYTERFRELLVESVHCRLRSRGPVGFLLSGGLDSSSIVGIARDSSLLGQGPLQTFSALFTNYPLINERRWMDEVTRTGNFEPTFVRVDQRSPIAELPKEIAEQGQPFYAPNNFVDSALMDSAASANMRVVLDGLDGDTTVGHGWEYLGELLRHGKWRRMLRLARQLEGHTDKSAAWFLWRHAVAPTVLGLTARATGRWGIRTPQIMRRAFAKEVGWVERIYGWRRSRGFDLLSDYRVQHWGKLRSGLMAMCFELASHQGGVRGIVRRHPYFDRRLVEFCVGLPADQRLDRGVDRIIQRRAVAGYAPEAIRTRLTKSIWVQNFSDRLALNESQVLRDWMEGKESPVAEFCDMAVIRKKSADILSRSATQRSLAEMWVAIALDVWLSMRW